MTTKIYWRKPRTLTRNRNEWGTARAVCAVLLLCTVTAVGSAAKTTFTNLVKLNSTEGANPYSLLVQGTDGNFYGTNGSGGANGNYGTIFKVTAAGKLTTLYNFCAQTGCTDGFFPAAGLVQGADGNFYGTTQSGGANGNYGTVFKITSKGKLTTLYSFCSQTNCADGSVPYGPLVQIANGDFYGTTSASGANSGGTVFKITLKGKLTTLYAFCSQSDCKDGESPTHGLTQGTDGNFYGTTGEGGAHSSGTVFKIGPKGEFSTLYSFCAKSNCTDGEYPYAGLVQGSDGNFYGTTEEGGSRQGGSVFKITSKGKLTVLYSFCVHTACSDGEHPYAGLVEGTDGNFYGTTSEGGSGSGDLVGGPPNLFGTYGTAFKVTPEGKLTTLYNFCSLSECADGSFPYAELVQGTNGNFYGATLYGGDMSCTMGCGTLFGMATGLSPFVEPRPNSGEDGAAVVILGNNLAGTTSVTFNGTVAEFTVVSKTEIKTTVPKGATTGSVEVKTPDHTLKSNVVFRVTK
jgi:uncharacterized repeat protein (TIGR03803 family)